MISRKILFIVVAALALSGCRKAAEVPQKATFTQTAVETQAAETSGTEDVVNLLKHRVGRGTSDIVLQRRAYITSYNKKTRTPNWVAWTLTREHTRGELLREGERFEEDPQVPEPRATYQDYYNTRYDRGHMCPAGDNKWDQEAMTESFLMTNVCPQNHGLNEGDWNDLEMQCRSWARKNGEVTVVCGPLFEDDEPRTIGRNKVRVPTGFFKLVYCDTPQPRALAFVFENRGGSQPWRRQLCSVDDVEQRTGFNFFPDLPDDVENVVEAHSDLADW